MTILAKRNVNFHVEVQKDSMLSEISTKKLKCTVGRFLAIFHWAMPPFVIQITKLNYINHCLSVVDLGFQTCEGTNSKCWSTNLLFSQFYLENCIVVT